MSEPRIAYVLHWFPEPSETFIFNEVRHLHGRGLDLRVLTLYGEIRGNPSTEMTSAGLEVERLGLGLIPKAPEALGFWRRRNPAMFRDLARTVPLRRWSDLEMAGENLWAFLCGFEVARRCEEEGIEHIHAPWANGPATAAWVASRLTGIPFSFAAHATDIYPPDGALAEKISAASFVRTENRANVEHLRAHAATDRDRQKIRLVYSGHPIRARAPAAVPMKPPFRLMALGRFVRKKGFDVLLEACHLLESRGIAWELTLGGEGPLGHRLRTLARRLDLDHRVHFPGFVPYEGVPGLLSGADVFIMPSVVDPSGDRDGLPNVIVEALMQRIPVVASDVCGISEVIRHGITGVLVPPGDSAALADGVASLIGDRGGAIGMAEAGRSLATELFHPERCFGAVRELLLGALPASGSRDMTGGREAPPGTPWLAGSHE